MAQVQALVLSCDEPVIAQALPGFFENELNLYAVDQQYFPGGAKGIVEEGSNRELIFNNFDATFQSKEIPLIILINHLNCKAYGGTSSYPSREDEVAQQEIWLRHGVSVVHSKYPDKLVEAYLAIRDNDVVSFKKVI